MASYKGGYCYYTYMMSRWHFVDFLLVVLKIRIFITFNRGPKGEFNEVRNVETPIGSMCCLDCTPPPDFIIGCR